MKKTETYEIRYGRYDIYKPIITTDFGQALRMYDKCISFAINHRLTWTVSIFEKLEGGRYWLIKSETVNGETVTYKDLIERI